jgi:hypothetical protein
VGGVLKDTLEAVGGSDQNGRRTVVFSPALGHDLLDFAVR